MVGRSGCESPKLGAKALNRDDLVGADGSPFRQKSCVRLVDPNRASRALLTEAGSISGLLLQRGPRFRLPLCGTGSATPMTRAGCHYERNAAALPVRPQRANNRLRRSQSNRQHRHDAAHRRQRADRSNSFPGPQSMGHIFVPCRQVVCKHMIGVRTIIVSNWKSSA
jgi:hypothetical protein